MNPPTVRRAAAVLAVVAAVLVLSGCFKARQDIAIKADGTGSIVLHVEVNKKAIEALARSFGDPTGGMGGASMAEPFKPVDTTFPDGTKVRAVNTPELSTVDASFDFSGPDDYARKLEQVGNAVNTDPDTSPPTEGAIVIRRTEDRMDVSLDVGDATQGVEDVDLSVLTGLLDPAAMPSAVVAITMPGSIVSSNGQADGRTVTWDLLSQTAPSTLTVTSEIDDSSLPAWALPAAGGLIVLLLLGILGVLLTQRRRPQPAGPGAYPQGAWPPAPQPA
ncbi:MAG: LppM family (lipo)protein, partial [Actinomycetes bacterium]